MRHTDSGPAGAFAVPAGTPAAPLDDPFDVMLVGWSFLSGGLLTAALDLGVFDTLGDGRLGAEELSLRTGLHPRAGRDFLDALASLGLLVRRDGRYRNSPGAARHLVTGRPGYVGGFLRMTSELTGAGANGALTGLLRTGSARGQDADGEVPFTRIFHDPGRLRQFLSAMDAFSGAIAPGVSALIDWSACTTFADIGGGRGNLAAHVAAAHPHLRGTVLDRPAMRPFFEELAAERGVAKRLRFAEGDFFEDELPRADVLVLGGVLHDWSDDRRALLLRKAYDAVEDGGTVIVYDNMTDDARERASTLLLSVVMMLQSARARLFAPAECASWMCDAGFTVERTAVLPALTTAVVGRKI